MKKITVISGKGGTGKTTLISNLALLAGDLVLADCDVDAPNMHLLLKPRLLNEESFVAGKLAVKDEDSCIRCGLCKEVCNFGAVSADYQVNAIKCEGCGVCVALCPTKVLKLVDEETGKLYHSECKFGPVVHARLRAGAENSGKLVSEVRKKADVIGEKLAKDLLLIDGSPGIGCPVIASLNGVDSALIVTEPTKSGLADLKRILQVCQYFQTGIMVVINKYDLNLEISAEVEKYCRENKIPLLGKIPFDPVMVEAIRKGELIVEYKPNSKPALAIKKIWQELVAIN